ncbi:MAG: hypothetical protein AUI85_06695 [Acidobacteriales bacterium 13_1_40CM_3_55_5]|nr:MAG: hypothetical protein AUI85_06695 [Acidobacteriales bacterium 13_1_40CM_3_55_5]
MTLPRSRWLSCLPLLLISIPLIAQRPGNPAAVSRTIPEGTTFLIRLQDKLDTKKLEQGKHFKAKLAEDLIAPDGSTIPRGKKIKATLVPSNRDCMPACCSASMRSKPIMDPWR